ncbi:hypothetical protein Tco_0359202 [Tanacetum coccineum]
MSDLKFADTHNLVAFLEKPTESEGFEEIVDFLNANPIKYALTVNPTIYCSCIKQFWDTVKAKTVNGEVQLQALVDKKKVIITESTIRRDLQLEDANGVDCLPNAAIFEQLTLMGKQKSGKYKKRNTKVPQPCGSTDNVPDENEDASKQRRKIADIDADVKVTLIDETRERNDDNLMFDTNVFDEQEVKVEKVVSTTKVTTESATTTTVDELTLAQTLKVIKATKPKVRGVMIQEPSEFTTTTTITAPAALKPLHDKGKAKMIKSEKPLKKKD